MSKRTTTHNKNVVFPVSRNLQLIFVITTVFGWFSWLVYLLIWSTGQYYSAGTWVYQISQTVFPLVWFLVALWFYWGKYASRLHRLFAAALLTTIGYGLYGFVSSLEQTVRFRFFAPVIKNPSDNSLLTAFGHDWLVMGIGLAVFVSIIAWKKHGRKGR
jgi:hypothetical protein